MKRDRSKDQKAIKDKYLPYMGRFAGHWVDRSKIEWFKEVVRKAALESRQYATPEEWYSIKENEACEKALLTPILDEGES